MKATIEGGSLVIERHGWFDRLVDTVRRNASFCFWSSLVLATLILALLTTLFLRQNNLNMIKLRDQLVEIDQTGDVALVQSAARKLQNYVAHHMNTATGRVALQTLYNQAAEEAMVASRPPEVDPTIYQQATDDCRAQFNNYGYRAWASCIATKVGVNTSATLTIADAAAPDPDLYYVDYAPARWSADLAGICLLLTVLLAAVLAIKLLAIVVHGFIHYCKNWRRKVFTGVDSK